jgi:His/Glu/Gln/Arg/opine family amino acid ABC transporter permease subunit
MLMGWDLMQKFITNGIEFLPILLQGVKLTILVTIGSLILSTVLGLMWALMRVSGNRFLCATAKVIVNTIRGIPIIVQLFYIYFVLPDFGISLSALQAAIIGLGVAYSAYQAENFRAGIEAIDHGQIEAALWQCHDHDAEGLIPGIDHHRRGTGLARETDRVINISEHNRLHHGRGLVSVYELATDVSGQLP